MFRQRFIYLSIAAIGVMLAALGQWRDSHAQKRGPRVRPSNGPNAAELARNRTIINAARTQMELATARESLRQQNLQVREGVLRRSNVEAWWQSTVAVAGTGKTIVPGQTTARKGTFAAILHLVVLIQDTGEDLTTADRRYMLIWETIRNLSYRLSDDTAPTLYVAREDNGVPVLIGTDETLVRSLAKEAKLNYAGADARLSELLAKELYVAKAFKHNWHERLKEHERAGNPCPNVHPPWETAWGLEFLEKPEPWPVTPEFMKKKQHIHDVHTELHKTSQEFSELLRQRDELLHSLADDPGGAAVDRAKAMLEIVEQLKKKQEHAARLHKQLMEATYFPALSGYR